MPLPCCQRPKPLQRPRKPNHAKCYSRPVEVANENRLSSLRASANNEVQQRKAPMRKVQLGSGGWDLLGLRSEPLLTRRK